MKGFPKVLIALGVVFGSFVFICVLGGLTSPASATAANDLLLCLSDNNFGCFGSAAGNGVNLFWNGTTLTTGTVGNGTIISSSMLNGNSAVTTSATLGVFSLNVSTAAFNPSPGTALDLATVNVSSSGPGALRVVAGADNYTGTGFKYNEVGSVTLSSGVTSASNTGCYEGGSGSFFICGTNVSAPIFGSGTATTTGALNFSGSVPAPSSPFGLEEDLLVAFSGAGTFSGDLTLVPEPGSIALMGSGLLGLVGFAVRRREAA